MPTLRQLLFLATGVIIGCYFFKSVDLLALGKGVAFDSVEEQHRVEANQSEVYDPTFLRAFRDSQMLGSLRGFKGWERYIEYLSGPRKWDCDEAEKGRRISRLYQSYADPIEDSVYIDIQEEIFNLCDRILDRCGMCPAVIQHHENPPRSDSDQIIEPDESQIRIIHQMPTIRFLIFLNICWIVGESIIGWHRVDIVKNIKPFLLRLLFKVIGLIIGSHLYTPTDLPVYRSLIPSTMSTVLQLSSMLTGFTLTYFLRIYLVCRRLPTLHKLLSLILDWVTCIIIFFIIQWQIDGTLSILADTRIVSWSFVLNIRYPYVTYEISIAVQKFFRAEFGDNSEKILEKYNQQLHHMIKSQIYIKRHLVAGATRFHILCCERGALLALQDVKRIRNEKAEYESKPHYKLMSGYDIFINQMELIITVGQRIENHVRTQLGDGSDKILTANERLLRLMHHAQRFVENHLNTGANRNVLRRYERFVMSILTRVSIDKSKYESKADYKLMIEYNRIICKMEEVITVGERVLYLCRPAAGA